MIAPPGQKGTPQVAAFYGGDSHYLASWSPRSTVEAISSLAILPATLSLQPDQQTTLVANGGVPPVRWAIYDDSTCDPSDLCSAIESLTATTGAFQAGPLDGTAYISVIDADGAEALGTIRVSGAPVAGGGGVLPPPWDGGYPDASGEDASSDVDGGLGDDAAGGEDGSGGEDAATDASDAAAPFDGAPTPDAGAVGGEDSGASADAGAGQTSTPGGCGCVTAGVSGGGPQPGVYAGALLFGAIAARRKRLSGARKRRADNG
jgi:hypothetical protein